MRCTKVKKEPVACDLCGTVVEDPWDAHFVQGDGESWLLCDKCNEELIEYFRKLGLDATEFESNTLNKSLQIVQELCDAEWRRDFCEEQS